MKNRELHIIARIAALRSFVEGAFEGSTGGWAGRRDAILSYIDQVEKEVRSQAAAKSAEPEESTLL